jgi:hypothetical protein
VSHPCVHAESLYPGRLQPLLEQLDRFGVMTKQESSPTSVDSIGGLPRDLFLRFSGITDATLAGGYNIVDGSSVCVRAHAAHVRAWQPCASMKRCAVCASHQSSAGFLFGGRVPYLDTLNALKSGLSAHLRAAGVTPTHDDVLLTIVMHANIDLVSPEAAGSRRVAWQCTCWHRHLWSVRGRAPVLTGRCVSFVSAVCNLAQR